MTRRALVLLAALFAAGCVDEVRLSNGGGKEVWR